MTERITGAILAGGQASRLGGTAKGLLQLDSGKTLIENLADQMKGAGIDDVIICADNSGLYARFGLEVVGDLHPDSGPLGGVEAALVCSAGRTDAVLFCPCDLPGMTSVQFARLMRAFAARPEDTGIVYAETSDFFWHPLCAVVHNELLASIRRAVEQGRRSVRRLWTELRAVGVMFEDPTPFFNVNTPDDVARLVGGDALKTTISASPELFEPLRAFIQIHGLPIEVVPTPDGTVEVVRGKRSDECGEDRLLAGGWISCACAHSMAAKLGIEPLSMGKLLKHLDIKVKRCELGLF